MQLHRSQACLHSSSWSLPQRRAEPEWLWSSVRGQLLPAEKASNKILTAYVPQAYARAMEQHRQALRETEVTDSVDRFGRSGISGGGRNPTLRAVTDPSRSFHELLQFLTLCQKMTHLGGEKFLTKTLAEVNFTPK